MIDCFRIEFSLQIKFGYWKRRGIDGPTPYPVVGTIVGENFPVSGKKIEEIFFKKYGLVYGTYAGTLPVFNTGLVFDCRIDFIPPVRLVSQSSFSTLLTFYFIKFSSEPEHIKHVLMNPEIFNQSAIFMSNDDYLKHAIFFNNGAKWKNDRTAMR